MVRCNDGSPLPYEDDNDINKVLCKSLQALLERDGVFAQSFLRDRSTLERIVKMVVSGGGHQQRGSAGTRPPNDAVPKTRKIMMRVQRSAGLHCIVLAFRLTRIDDFAAETCLPVFIAGALSGVIAYPCGEQKEENLGTSGKTVSTASTRLSSAQELVSHAAVNPLVGPAAFAAMILSTNFRTTYIRTYMHARNESPCSQQAPPHAREVVLDLSIKAYHTASTHCLSPKIESMLPWTAKRKHPWSLQ